MLDAPGQGAHFLLAVVVVEIEIRRVQEFFLNVVHGRARQAYHRSGDAVLADIFLPRAKALVARHEFDVLEQVAHHLVVLGPLDHVLFDPGDRGSGAPHFVRVHGLGAHASHRRVIEHRGVVAFALHLDVDRGCELVVEHHFLQAIDAQGAVQRVLGLVDLEELGHDLVQRPPLSARDFVLRPALVLRRQGVEGDVGVVPEVDARHVGKGVRHLPLQCHQYSLLMAEHALSSLVVGGWLPGGQPSMPGTASALPNISVICKLLI